MEKLTCSVRYLVFAALAVLFTGVTAAAQRPGAGKGGSQDGIKVHGHWVIEVRNPDGSLAVRRELQNALYVGAQADMLLAELLNGDLAAGHWIVLVSGGALCNANNTPCSIAEAGIARAANSKNLTATVPTTGVNAKKLVLSGSIKASAAGDVTLVESVLTTCSGSTAPAACVEEIARFFTTKFVDPRIPVQANQTLDITVVISFS